VTFGVLEAIRYNRGVQYRNGRRAGGASTVDMWGERSKLASTLSYRVPPRPRQTNYARVLIAGNRGVDIFSVTLQQVSVREFGMLPGVRSQLMRC
jgi:hypothetical protein